MSVRVTFDIFSGLPNPVVTLDGKDATELLKRLQPSAKLSPAEAVAPSESILGYRGMLIEQIGTAAASVPLRGRVVDGKLFAQNVAYQLQGSDIEEFVLGATSAAKTSSLSSALTAMLLGEAKLRKATAKGAQLSPAAAPSPPTICACAPLYEPNWWNDNGQKQLHNNCYNYACNYRTDTFAQPGRAGGLHMTAISCPGVKPSALSDDLLDTPAGKVIICPKEGQLAALVIWPNWDFHWYRFGRDGFWSHKPGSTPVTNLDNSGRPITDPRKADRGHYTDFCSFMIVMHGHIKIS